jgi:hypothetical protein
MHTGRSTGHAYPHTGHEKLLLDMTGHAAGHFSDHSAIAPPNLPPATTSHTLLLLQLTVMRTAITCCHTALTLFDSAAADVHPLQLTMTRAAATS